MNKFVIVFILLVGLLAAYVLFQDKSQPQNNEKESVVKFEKQGVQIEILKAGSGDTAENNDIVTVHYTGWLQDGTKFDSSVDRNKPFKFVLGIGQVIKGWDIGVSGMSLGEKRKLTIPSNLAYGEAASDLIPANSILIFEVELLAIQR